jgi:hypothetical protein
MNKIRNVIFNSFTIIVVFVLSSFAYSDNVDIEQIVKELGSSSDPVVEIEIISKYPKESVPLLIMELHTVSVVRILNWEKKPNAEHVIWCIRALRFTTGGKDFCAPTRYRFGKGEVETRRKDFLRFRNPHCLPFFVLWSSRYSHYIAPIDTQKAIILKWQKWYETEGKFTDLKPLVNPKPQDWLW